MGNYTKTLLIGCGGSGIKTLIRLNQLLSSNPMYRNDVRENISYLVIDTNSNDLDGFDAKIKSQMGETGAPNIAQAHITARLNNLNQIISPNFDSLKGNNDAVEKMKTHWMYTPDGEEPFRANQIRDLGKGAGQCCQISYLTTWNYLQRLEGTLSDMVDEIRKRNTDEDLDEFQVFLVAGLAGGTGRGSWQLIAFKVRQFLQEQGIKADITAIFFDASCYPNVSKKANKTEKENLIVNSYTAMSELSGWLRLKEAKQYQYALPYIDNPDSAVIKVYDDGDITHQSPVLRAFLVFGSNGSTGNLLNNAQYHDMAATALYSMVVYPGPVNEIFSNKRINIGSLGATTFEVDSYHLRSFFETAVQKKFLEKQCAELEKTTLSDEVNSFIGEMSNPAPDTFLGKNSIWLPENIRSISGHISLDSQDGEKNLSLLQKLMLEIDKEYPRSKQKADNGAELKGYNTQNIEKKLKEQKRDPVNTAINNALQLGSLDENIIVKALNDVLAQSKLDDANRNKTLDKLVLDQFAPEGKEVSLGRSILFAQSLKKIFEGYQKVLKGIAVQGCKDLCTTADDVAKILTDKEDGLVQKAYTQDNGFLGMGDKFNAKEIQAICGQFQYCMYAAVFFKLQPALIDFYKKAAERLTIIEQALNDMVDILKKTNVVLDGNFGTDFGNISYDDIIAKLFINAEDSDSVLGSIPPAASLKNVFYRQLKPIMSINEINQLLSDEKNVRVNRKPIMEQIGKQLANLLLISDSSAKDKRFDSVDDAKKILPKEFCKLIAANVHLEEKVGRKTFMEEHFSFEDVLKKNIKCWNKLLKESSSVQLANLKDQLRDFLGVTDGDYDEENCLNTENVLKGIIKSLVRSSKPWIQIVQDSSNSVSEVLDCTILLPVPLAGTDALQSMIDTQNTTTKKSMRSHIHCPDANSNALNLPSDRIVVFNAEVLEDQKDYAPMDKIQNLTTWKQDSAISELLKLAEKPREHETAWFYWKEELKQWVEKDRGMAYVSPIFTEEPHLQRLRWHPWIKETASSLEEQLLTKAYRALFYAFIGVGIEDTSTLKQTLSTYNCEDPLMTIKGQDFIFNYAPRLWKDGKMDFSAKSRTWAVCDTKNKGKDARLAHSINHVVDYLCGKGFSEWKLDEGKKIQDSKDSGKILCDAMLKEADDFFVNVFQNLAVTDRKLLVEKLHDCFVEHQNATSQHDEDRPYWDALVKCSEDEAEELGVTIQ